MDLTKEQAAASGVAVVAAACSSPFFLHAQLLFSLKRRTLAPLGFYVALLRRYLACFTLQPSVPAPKSPQPGWMGSSRD